VLAKLNGIISASSPVIPAKAGIQRLNQMPLKMSVRCTGYLNQLNTGLRRYDEI
jgi:hypothetical protein